MPGDRNIKVQMLGLRVSTSHECFIDAWKRGFGEVSKAEANLGVDGPANPSWGQNHQGATHVVSVSTSHECFIDARR